MSRKQILPDKTELTKQNLVFEAPDGRSWRIDILSASLFRVRRTEPGQGWTESALNRYGILRQDWPETPCTLAQTASQLEITTTEARLVIALDSQTITLYDPTGQLLTSIQDSGSKQEAHLRARMTEDEKIYGLGDSSRKNIMRRGDAYEIWVLNVISYIPIPMLLSSRKWGLLLNSTWHNFFDVGKTEHDIIDWHAPNSETDFYLFAGKDLPDLLKTYTSLAGRPALLPVWAYSFAYVCNQQVDAFRMMDEARTMRQERIPCDIIGLEPGWMQHRYDYSTKKSWHDERFYIPPWCRKGNPTFFGALDRLGYKLSLWLCCDYDLSIFEEQEIASTKPPMISKETTENNDDSLKRDRKYCVGYRTDAPLPGSFEQDEHLDGFKKADGKTDKPAQPEPLEPWYRHLQAFVDQGVQAFKLDGANQVNVHPDRQWGNGMPDQQLHNLYPLLWGKQMALGYEQQTGKRPMIYSAAGYAGLQRYVASWAGDTGGGPDTLASMLNLGLSGHSNHSCDMDVFSPQHLHFGFLQTWAQLNNWAYWRQPWYLTEDGQKIFKFYAHLRNRLLPYLYSSAYQAALTGLPVMRAMPLVFPDEDFTDFDKSQYMLGNFLLVPAFQEKIRLPKGTWRDAWTHKSFIGPAMLPMDYPKDRGGCLFLREGAIIPLWPYQDHVDAGFHQDLTILVNPGSSLSEFVLYEDDGVSLAYRNGGTATTRLECEPAGNNWNITVYARIGSFTGMNKERQLTFRLCLDAEPSEITMEGRKVEGIWNPEAHEAIVSLGTQPVDKDIIINIVMP